MLFSQEIIRADSVPIPPYTEECPLCPHSDVLYVPYATIYDVDTSIVSAFYHHGYLGHQWTTNHTPWPLATSQSI